MWNVGDVRLRGCGPWQHGDMGVGGFENGP